jgi:hypothetical protein
VAVNAPPPSPPERPVSREPLRVDAPLTIEELGPSVQLPAHPPAPPQRPLDLGASAGSDAPIRVSRR